MAEDRATPATDGRATASQSPIAEDRLFDRPSTHRAIQVALVVACVLVLLSDLLYHKHAHFGFEGSFGFHAFFGFVAYLTIVNTAKLLRRFVKRPENYYD